jgi:APA family basic amino acid/polyamine antiporter
MSEAKLQRKLSLFNVTNLVIGAIIGADIYVASYFGAEYLGPFSLVVWVIAGLIAIVIALCFAQCAMLLPKVGGPYAYAKGGMGTIRRVHRRLVAVVGRVDFAGGFSFSVR